MEDAAGDQGAARDRRREKAIEHTAVDVAEQPHPRVRGAEEGRHDGDSGSEELDVGDRLSVGVALETGDGRHRLEKLAEEQHPENGLDDGDDDEHGHPHRGSNQPYEQVPGVLQEIHD